MEQKTKTKDLITSLKPPAKVTKFNKILLDLMVFLLRRGWMGSASDIMMVITTTGRKTGRKHTIPIGYLRDGDSLIALNNEGGSHWIQNVLANGEATLEVKGEVMQVRGEFVADERERQVIFNLYKKDAKFFQSNFRLPLKSTEEELQKALSTRKFIRFQRK